MCLLRVRARARLFRKEYRNFHIKSIEMTKLKYIFTEHTDKLVEICAQSIECYCVLEQV